MKVQERHYRNGIQQLDTLTGIGLLYLTSWHTTVYSDRWVRTNARSKTILPSARGPQLSDLISDHPNVVSPATYSPSGRTAIFTQNGQVIYGEYRSGVPWGPLCIASRDEKLFLVAERGEVISNSKVLLVVETYGIALLFHIVNTEPLELQLIDKLPLTESFELSHELAKCSFPKQSASYFTGIIKYLNALTQDATAGGHPQLRLLDSGHYRFGFKKGLAVVFDDDNNVQSMGMHAHAGLNSIGFRKKGNRLIEEGDFSDPSCVLRYCEDESPTRILNRLYRFTHLQALLYEDYFLSDPSKEPLKMFQGLLKEVIAKKFISGLVSDANQISQRDIQESQENENTNSQKPEITLEHLLKIQQNLNQQIKNKVGNTSRKTFDEARKGTDRSLKHSVISSFTVQHHPPQEEVVNQHPSLILKSVQLSKQSPQLEPFGAAREVPFLTPEREKSKSPVKIFGKQDKFHRGNSPYILVNSQHNPFQGRIFNVNTKSPNSRSQPRIFSTSQSPLPRAATAPQQLKQEGKITNLHSLFNKQTGQTNSNRTPEKQFILSSHIPVSQQNLPADSERIPLWAQAKGLLIEVQESQNSTAGKSKFDSSKLGQIRNQSELNHIKSIAERTESEMRSGQAKKDPINIDFQERKRKFNHSPYLVMGDAVQPPKNNILPRDKKPNQIYLHPPVGGLKNTGGTSPLKNASYSELYRRKISGSPDNRLSLF